ncbi:hypothetical protein KNE206_32190 [Kitasatospora sp. NE20-6]
MRMVFDPTESDGLRATARHAAPEGAAGRGLPGTASADGEQYVA